MSYFRKPDPDKLGEEEEEMKQRVSRVYQAPELLLGRVTPAADVYAYAIILIEIATRNDPYGVSIHRCVQDKRTKICTR